MIIYKITNKLDGKLYIGQTTQALSERWWQHCNRCPSQSHRSYIYNAIQKDGVENFIVEQIDVAGTLETLNLLEVHYIKKFNTIAPNGYNLYPGGMGKTCHPDTKAKISASLKGRPIKNRMNGAPKGRSVSPERRAQISKTLTGRPNKALYKPIIAIETGIIYRSINEAAKSLNLNRVTISGLLKSGKQSRLGLTFKLYKE